MRNVGLKFLKLWIFTPTASTALMSGFGATQKLAWLLGVHFLAEYLRIAIAAIDQLTLLIFRLFRCTEFFQQSNTSRIVSKCYVCILLVK